MYDRKAAGVASANARYKDKKYNMLTFVRHAERWGEPYNGKRPIGVWKCDCGVEKEILIASVREGKTKCCGCLTGRDGGKHNIGKKWGKLTLVDLKGVKDTYNYGEFLCDCGTKVNAKIANVISGLRKSCGCDLSKILREKRGFNLNETVFDEITEESAYWIGFLMADGNVSKNTVCINLKASDVNHLEKFRSFVGGNQKISIAKDPRIVRYAFSSVKIAKKLSDLGVIPAKSLSASPHPLLISNPHFWRGMVDGDGSIYADRKTIALCGTKAMCDGFLSFAKTYINTKATTNLAKKTGTLYHIRIGVGNKNKLPLLEAMYGDASIYLDRKYLLASAILGLARPK
jgi:hypothetical protein